MRPRGDRGSGVIPERWRNRRTRRYSEFRPALAVGLLRFRLRAVNRQTTAGRDVARSGDVPEPWPRREPSRRLLSASMNRNAEYDEKSDLKKQQHPGDDGLREPVLGLKAGQRVATRQHLGRILAVVDEPAILQQREEEQDCRAADPKG